MASVTISHHPELTAEDVVAIFQKQFGDKYEIIPTPRAPHYDLIVKRSAWTGICVLLKQGRSKTRLVFKGNPPSAWARMVVLLSIFPSVLLAILFWHLFVWKGITDEVRAFIETAEEFR
jgi:hypothetical protein